MSPVAQMRAWTSAALGLAISALLFPPGASAQEAPAGPAQPAPAGPAQEAPARPPPLPPLASKPLPWERILDIGGEFAIVARPATGDRFGNPSPVRYEVATGFALHIRWPLLKYLQIEGYFVDVHLPVKVPLGGLGLDAAVTSPPVETFVFGVRASPRMTWGPITGWLTAGAGWGRFEFRRMTATNATGVFALRERGGSFVELPLGFGVSFEIIKRWLTLDLQATAAFVLEQHGEAFDSAQTVDAAGKLREVGPMPIIDASLVQTIGFSLLL